jgi:hypothetical protein
MREGGAYLSPRGHKRASRGINEPPKDIHGHIQLVMHILEVQIIFKVRM